MTYRLENEICPFVLIHSPSVFVGVKDVHPVMVTSDP